MYTLYIYIYIERERERCIHIVVYVINNIAYCICYSIILYDNISAESLRATE